MINEYIHHFKIADLHQCEYMKIETPQQACVILYGIPMYHVTENT